MREIHSDVCLTLICLLPVLAKLKKDLVSVL